MQTFVRTMALVMHPAVKTLTAPVTGGLRVGVTEVTDTAIPPFVGLMKYIAMLSLDSNGYQNFLVSIKYSLTAPEAECKKEFNE